MKASCLIVDEMHEAIFPLLKQAELEIVYKPSISKDEFISTIHEYEGLLVRSRFQIDADIISKATRLKFIARAGAGMDNIDVKAAEEKNITVLNAPEGNRDALAEHTVAMLLTLLNRIVVADKQVRNGEWKREENRGTELKDKTVALIGYGYMGKATAKRLSSFGCKLLVYDKYLNDYSDEHVQESSMEEINEKADIVSLHIPLTDETKFSVNAEYLKKFKKKIWFVNTARGEIVSLKELAEAIQSGIVAGAALDVLENEKLKTFTETQQKSFDLLKKSEQVIFTPHIGGWTKESYEKISKVLGEKIIQFMSK